MSTSPGAVPSGCVRIRLMGELLRAEFRVATGDRPLLLNGERKAHWSARSSAVEDWHTATSEALTEHKVPRGWGRVTFAFWPVYPVLPIPDTAAVYPTTKAIVDACVNWGVIVSDKPEWNRGEFQGPPIVNPAAPYPLIVVEIAQVGSRPVLGPDDF